MMNSGHVIHKLLLLISVIFLHDSRACFISNCPLGGKRSSARPYRQCLPCGPNNSGRCIGPAICCGKSFGCLINTKETLSCRKESELATPCENRAEQCLSVTGGHCAAVGICCNERSCVLDDTCTFSISHLRDESMLMPSSDGEQLYETGVGDRFWDFLFHHEK